VSPYFLLCKKCHESGPVEWYKDDAIKEWNKLSEELRMLKMCNQGMKTLADENAEMRQAIKVFCEATRYSCDDYKKQDHVKPLFDMFYKYFSHLAPPCGRSNTDSSKVRKLKPKRKK